MFRTYLTLTIALISLATARSEPFQDRAARGNPQGTTLLEAAGNGNVAEVSRMIAAGAAVDEENRGGVTPLMAAAFYGHTEVARLLIAAGADVNFRDDNGGTPLEKATVNGHAAIVRLLLDKGADVNTSNKLRSTPLHLAAGRGHTEVVRLLLAKGADISVRDEDGSTPLYIALMGAGPATKRTEVAQLLSRAVEEKRSVLTPESGSLTIALAVVTSRVILGKESADPIRFTDLERRLKDELERVGFRVVSVETQAAAEIRLDVTYRESYEVIRSERMRHGIKDTFGETFELALRVRDSRTGSVYSPHTLKLEPVVRTFPLGIVPAVVFDASLADFDRKYISIFGDLIASLLK